MSIQSTFIEIHCIFGSRIRKAKTSELQELFDLINAAYKVEIGTSGLSFKSADRYRNLEELAKDLQWMSVLEIEETGKLVGAVKAQIVENTVDIGPLAVDPNHQVNIV